MPRKRIVPSWPCMRMWWASSLRTSHSSRPGTSTCGANSIAPWLWTQAARMRVSSHSLLRERAAHSAGMQSPSSAPGSSSW